MYRCQKRNTHGRRSGCGCERLVVVCGYAGSSCEMQVNARTSPEFSVVMVTSISAGAQAPMRSAAFSRASSRPENPQMLSEAQVLSISRWALPSVMSRRKLSMAYHGFPSAVRRPLTSISVCSSSGSRSRRCPPKSLRAVFFCSSMKVSVPRSLFRVFNLSPPFPFTFFAGGFSSMNPPSGFESPVAGDG